MAHDMEDSIKITSRRPAYQRPRRVAAKTRLSVRNGFLVSGNYLEASTTESPGTCAAGVGGGAAQHHSGAAHLAGLVVAPRALTVI